MKIAFALVAHSNPELVARLIRILIAPGHWVAIHYDLQSPVAEFAALTEAFAGNPAVRFARRIRVGWGEWSVVQATLNCLDEIDVAGWHPDYVYHLSGMDYPIRPSAQLVAFLERNRGDEFIESVPADGVRWVKTGPQQERYLYRWYFNWRDQPRRTDLLYALQKRLHLERPFVRDMVPHIGSQWWVLTWATLRRVMEMARAPDIAAFFRSTLVPDEVFFHTLVRYLVANERLVSCPLTLYQFTDYGTPLVYHADHLDYLLRQNFFMARKLSPHDATLRDALDPHWLGERQVARFADANVGLVGQDYEDRRLTYRDGPPASPIAGRSNGSWYDEQKRLNGNFFVVIGTSTAELRIVHRALSWHPDLLCHGQLFHPTRIEFAEDLSGFAGYSAEDLPLREVSAPNFVADIVRAETHRMSGLLLGRGQGWHVPELMMDRPNVRVIVLRGCPLVAFSEAVFPIQPLLSEDFDPTTLTSIPPTMLATRFRRFLADFAPHVAWLDHQVRKAEGVKPRHWIIHPDLSGGRRDWHGQVETCLGISLAAAPPEAQVEVLHQALAGFDVIRHLARDRLTAGGVPAVILDMLEQQSDKPALALSLL